MPDHPTNPPPPPKRKGPQPAPGSARITQDLVQPIPGIPVTRAKPDPAIIAAARQAARASSPDLIEHRLTEVERDVSGITTRLQGIELGQDRVVRAVEKLSTEVDEWKLANSSVEVTKVKEEQKTKRFNAIVGVLMALCTIGGTIVTNIVMAPTPEPKLAPPMSQTDKEYEECNRIPSLVERAACGEKITFRKLSVEKR
jgi:hypothetical protein